jgi:hypothetical protein
MQYVSVSVFPHNIDIIWTDFLEIWLWSVVLHFVNSFKIYVTKRGTLPVENTCVSLHTSGRMEGTLFGTRVPEGGRPNYCNTILTVLQKPSSIALQSIFSDAVCLTYTNIFSNNNGSPKRSVLFRKMWNDVCGRKRHCCLYPEVKKN